jgi:small subunit ribosomal protein S4e
MDLISVPLMNENYVVLFDEAGRLTLNKVENADVKLCKIVNKTVIKGGHIQLNLHDGRNQIVTVADASKAEEDVYKTGDSILLSIPEQKIAGHVQFGENKLAYVTGGKHVGEFAKIVEIEERKLYADIITLETKDGEQFKTVKDYVFIVGDNEPVINL